MGIDARVRRNDRGCCSRDLGGRARRRGRPAPRAHEGRPAGGEVGRAQARRSGRGLRPEGTVEGRGAPEGARCGGLGEEDLTITGDAASPDFRFAQGPVFITVGSTAQVYRTLADANASWRRGASMKTATCLADIVRLSAEPGQNIKGRVGEADPFPAVSPKSTAYRLVLSVGVGNGPRLPAYVDAVILQHGRIQTGLVFTSIGQPVGEVDRVALATVVAARMAKANGPNGPVA